MLLIIAQDAQSHYVTNNSKYTQTSVNQEGVGLIGTVAAAATGNLRWYVFSGTS